MSFFEELKRRNVIRVGIAYVVIAWLIMQFSDIVLNNIEAPGWVFQVIMLVLAIGLPLALFFAWAFEMTPEGIKKEKDVDRSLSVTPQTGKKLNTTILLLLTLAIAYLLFDKFSAPAQPGSDHFSQQTSRQTTSTNEKSALTPVEATAQTDNEAKPTTNRQSIAVLPFENRSNREEDQFFTDGIHDDLLTTIARIGSMKVISRTSVMEYRGTTKKIPEIALELGVANILEGGIQRSGDQVRINVQLIDAQTDEHLWAEIFDRELTAKNLFAIQSEISQKIADALETTLTPEETKRINTMPTQNLAAYDAYLKGRQLMATRASDALKQATREFQKAVELDPQFALAWVGIADSHNLLATYGTFPEEQALLIRKEAVEKALEIDDRLGEAYASLGTIYGQTNQWLKAEEAYLKAIELSPNYATAWHWLSNGLRGIPLRIDESIEYALKSAELDPRSSVIRTNLASTYVVKGLYSMGERQYLTNIELDPEFPLGYRGLAGLYIFDMGRYAEGMNYALQSIQQDPGNLWGVINPMLVYLEVGDFKSAAALRERMADIDSTHKVLAFADALINVHRSNPEGVREAINWALPKFPNDIGTRFYFGRWTYVMGDPQRGLEIYLETEPGWLLEGRWQELINEYATDACLVSFLLIDQGHEDTGRALLKQATHYLTRELPAVNEHADNFLPQICHAANGDIDQALAAIETNLAHNHLSLWDEIYPASMFDIMRNEPRFIAAMQERNRRVEAQREAIDQMTAEAGL